jgi:trehalose 6-phosphate phosphatase
MDRLKIMTEDDVAPVLAVTRTAWFFDIDGTLIELAATPDGVCADRRIATTLAQLRDASQGAVALISGRTVAAVDRLFGELRLPAAGQHGVERRDAAGVTHYHRASSQRLAAARHALALWASERPQLLLEDKGLSLALHYRMAPDMGEAVRDFIEAMVAASGGDLCMQPGKMVVEIKPAGRDKGIAIAEFMAEAPFLGRQPVFVGDDASDEYGFAVVNRLGGVSIKVGDGPTTAALRLPDVTAVRAWLAGAAGAPA